MSIQDETFPDDEFLDELNFSPTSTQFPHHKHHDRQHAPPMSTSTSTNTSSSSATSDPAGLSDDASKKHSEQQQHNDLNNNNNNNSSSNVIVNEKRQDNINMNNNNNNNIKTKSFHEIHSAYTKRRYQHVGSKVAVYIANLKAEDEKRKNAKQKFQRHLSMPETLGETTASNGEAGMQKMLSPFFSAGELHKMYDFNSDGEIDLSEHSERPSSSSCNEMSSSDYADKIPQMQHEIERLEAYNEHLQTLVDEKSSENSCLKRNMHMLRIELCKYQDQLKLKSRQVMNNNFLQAPYHYGQPVWRGQTKATQTDFVLELQQQLQLHQQQQQEHITPSTLVTTPLTRPSFKQSVCALYVTPETPEKDNYDNNNNNSNKFGSLQEGVNHQSGGVTTTTNNNTNNTTTTVTTSSKYQIKRIQLLTDDEDEIQAAAELNVPMELSSYKRNLSENDAGTSGTATTAAEITVSTTKRKRKSRRKSWLSIFGPCVRCNDANQTVGNNNNTNSKEQSYTQVPLLETSML